MSPLVFFTGPSGSGKTTTARAWTGSRGQPTAFIDDDTIRSFVRNGEVSEEVAALRRRSMKDFIAQYHLSASVCAAMVRAYRARGVGCAVASQRSPDGAAPPEWRGGWADFDTLDPLFVVLFPSLDTCLARNRARYVGKQELPDEQIVSNYGFGWEGWRAHPRAVFVDSTEMTMEDVVARVNEIVP